MPEDFNLRGFYVFALKSGRYNSTGGNLTINASIIHGWQFLGVGQELATRPEELLRITHVTAAEDGGKKTETPFLRSEFYLNSTNTTSDDVPYNSTLWFNGTRINLAAPFLNFQRGTENWYAPYPLI